MEGTFVWASGEPVTYTNWNVATGEPNDSGGNEDYVAINWHYAQLSTTDHSTWNDTPVGGTVGYGGTSDGPYFGIVEVVPEPAGAAASLFVAAGVAVIGRRRRC